MSGEARLGLCLARGRTPGEAYRAVSTVLAHLVGTWIMLVVLAAVRAEIALPSYDGDGLPFLVLTVAATVGVPIAVLLATVARLSAALRDRRLANLRVLGLSPARTRVVAAVEAGAGAAMGSLLGVVAFWVSRPFVRDLDVVGRDWSTTSFSPWPIGAVLVVVVLPLVAITVALVPVGRSGGALTSAARPAPSTPPRLWRILPLPGGLALAASSSIGADGQLDWARFAVLVAGGVLTVGGLVVVIPVFTRVIADLVVRVPGRPTLRIAGRRLQGQPAGVSRIVAGLLVALFIVAGARMVLLEFQDSPQYRMAERKAGDGPAGYSLMAATSPDRSSGVADVPALIHDLRSLDGVLGAYPQWQVMTSCGPKSPCVNAFVGTCADVMAAVPDARGCRDDRSSWLDSRPDGIEAAPSLVWTSGQENPDRSPRGPTATLPTPARDAAITSNSSSYAVGESLQAQLFVPASATGIAEVVAASSADTVVPITVQVDPRVMSEHQLEQAADGLAPEVEVYDPWEDGSYEFISGLQTLTWVVAALVLSLGLLGFAVATIDRAISRRAEMVSLQLLGTGRSVIRAAQWWEAAVPLLVGVVIAIGAGSTVGYVYLSIAEGTIGIPWQAIGTLTLVSAASAVVVAALTVAACAPRIRPDLIRHE